jgi:hypothetical protein
MIDIDAADALSLIIAAITLSFSPFSPSALFFLSSIFFRHSMPPPLRYAAGAMPLT